MGGGRCGGGGGEAGGGRWVSERSCGRGAASGAGEGRAAESVSPNPYPKPTPTPTTKPEPKPPTLTRRVRSGRERAGLGSPRASRARRARSGGSADLRPTHSLVSTRRGQSYGVASPRHAGAAERRPVGHAGGMPCCHQRHGLFPSDFVTRLRRAGAGSTSSFERLRPRIGFCFLANNNKRNNYILKFNL